MSQPSLLRSAYTETAERELTAWPGVTASFERTAKHQRAVFSFGGATRFVVFPTSGSDSRRGALNFLADMRKELRALGAVRVDRQSTSERRPRAVSPPRPVSAPTITDPRPDGFAALRDLQQRMSEAAAPTSGVVQIAASPPECTRWQMFCNWVRVVLLEVPAK